MINFLLKRPLIYRFYQKAIRKKYDEYDFFKFIFEKKKLKNIRMLDICCGDSYILEYVSEFVEDYLGVDNNDSYLNKCRKRWKKFNFIKLDLDKDECIDHFVKFKPNFIFINGAIHHLNDKIVKSISSFVTTNFPESYFLSVDGVKDDNTLLNSLLIKIDRGKYIRSKSHYAELLNFFETFIIDDFYKFSYKYIFHYRNFNLKEFYYQWKNENK